MQFFRGAVNAISAPYQYYKDLPPINPATLTGAIDVIVIQRPGASGDSELACSPFHVRFGKWQVLRPGEKKVTVSVNGHPIPFDMKIGEAGEAFFVFETDDDVPADLITSPILQPVQPEEDTSKDADIETDRFGAKGDRKDRDGKSLENGDAAREPEFLDLNASEDDRSHTPQPSTPPPQSPHPPPPSSQDDPTPQPARQPSGISLSKPIHALPSPPPSPTMPSATPESMLARTGTKMDRPDDKVNEAVRVTQSEVHVPEVLYHHDVALDMAGYHSHEREQSDQTVTADEEQTEHDNVLTPSPSTSRALPQTPKPRPRSLKPANPEHAKLKIASPTPGGSVTFPIVRATSEPPPEDAQHRPPPPMQEYSWEWGAFPQPSPMKTTFGKGAATVRGKNKGKGRDLAIVDSDDEAEGNTSVSLGGVGEEVNMHRSHSVPPELEGSPSASRREVELPPMGGMWDEYDVPAGPITGFGAGGRLKMNRREPTRFRVHIEGKTSDFELSLVDAPTVFDGRDEVEADRVFERGKVMYDQFLDDGEVVRDKRLVIRWAGEQYITRNDDSPLMDALALWRDAALRARAHGLPTPRSASPVSSADSDDQLKDDDDISEAEGEERVRSKSEPPDAQLQSTRKPTSSSWVRWWSRSRNSGGIGAETTGKGQRPGLRGSASAPLEGVAAKVTEKKDTPGDVSPNNLSHTSSIAFPQAIPAKQPELPKTPIGSLEDEKVPTLPRGKKYAKTLRLSSDQLKSLNLKAGANTITFSLSASGVVACTARIFVWDSTDLVVVSDIDGTITKSDGLGHIFTMIGRDWTHLGVAKLYTDITRNGYKIMYLTSRAIGQADATRDYLKGIKQNDYQLPEGPVIMSPDRLMASLHREVIMRKPEVFKMACLRDIQRLFGEASRNPFYAGFGNRITDALSYRSVNVPSARIFTIDSSGEVKMELLELAGYKSSYIHMTDLVDQMFPPIHRKWAPEFTDFNYWKAPVREFPLPDLAPPSPALSARSDTTLARLRNFSLVGSRQTNNTSRFSLPPPTTEAESGHNARRKSSDLREMTSFERLSNTLAQFTQTSSSASERGRSLSPDSRASSSSTYLDSGSEDEDGDDGDNDMVAKRRRRRERRTSMESMPGSLPGTDDDMHFGMDEHADDDIEDGYQYDDEEHEGLEDEEEAAEDAFDEDYLAAGEMKNVPFL